MPIIFLQPGYILQRRCPSSIIILFQVWRYRGLSTCKKDVSIYTTTIAVSIYTQHSMELSSRRVFSVRVPVSFHWTRRYRSGYEVLDGTADGYNDEKRKPNRGTAPRKLRLGHRRRTKVLFIAGIYRRFRVRIVRVRSYSWGLLLKRLKAFYRRLLAEVMETAPTLEMLIKSAPQIFPHSFWQTNYAIFYKVGRSVVDTMCSVYIWV